MDPDPVAYVPWRDSVVPDALTPSGPREIAAIGVMLGPLLHFVDAWQFQVQNPVHPSFGLPSARWQCGYRYRLWQNRGSALQVVATDTSSVKSRGSCFLAKLGTEKGKSAVLPRLSQRTKEGQRTGPYRSSCRPILGQKPRGLNYGSSGKIAVQFCSTVEATNFNHTLIQFGLLSRGSCQD
jgi:hypothetical protein